MTTRLQDYIRTIHNGYFGESPILVQEDGSVAARFFKCRILTRFEPIWRVADGALVGVEARVRAELPTGHRLPTATLFALAQADEALARLDRLCRTVHVLNYYGRDQYPPRVPLHLNVHPRLPGRVKGEHGAVFERLLGFLEREPGDLVIELPPAVSADPVLTEGVIQNYQRHGFKVAVDADPRALLWITAGVARPDWLKLDLSTWSRDPDRFDLLSHLAANRGVPLILKQVQQPAFLSEAIRRGAVAWQGKGLPAWELAGSARVQSQYVN